MFPQLVNIVAGFILGAPKLKEWGGKEFFEKLENFLKPYQTWIGWATLIVGVLTLLERLGSTSLYYGASFSQAVPAILIGLLLLSGFFEKYPALHSFIKKLEPYKIWIGLWGIAAGLVSMLVGCVVC